MSDSIWPFELPANCAVITLRPIAFDGAPILHVSHDSDAEWQFLGSAPPDTEQAVVLALIEIVQLDPTVLHIADLPRGWRAWRESIGAPWQRQRSIEDGA